jgi:Fe-S cluster assembly protein SufD
MSPDVFVDSRPFLEILANDVFCTHGSTTGKLNEEQLFYAKSRGLSKKEAERILIDGFINEVYNKVQEKVPEFKARYV